MKGEEIYLGGKRLRLDARNAIGKGGEADVYDIGKGQALKLFKPPHHPDFALDNAAQQAAQARLDEHQHKLRQFPAGLPAAVVTPQNLATDARGAHIAGYSMALVKGAEVLLRWSDRTWRESSGLNNNDGVYIFQQLHHIVSKIHGCGVVIGDFNDLNVLVKDKTPHLIDADSFSFGAFPCRVWTERFVDPTLCDASSPNLVLNQHHNDASDWYAFCVMLMQCLLGVEPYGGLFRPKDKSQNVPHGQRWIKRITVFHPEVRYPKPAIPFQTLPDDLLNWLQGVFEKDQRAPFPPTLLDLRWTKCRACGTQHARTICPDCVQPHPFAVSQTVVVRGTLTATRVFITEGVILTAAWQGGSLRYLFHHRGQFERESSTRIATGDLDTKTRFALQGKRTLTARDGQAIVLQDGVAPQHLAVDSYQAQAVMASNSKHIYWAHGGQLWREGQLAPQRIGDILSGQTQFWCGEQFGFGFARAGEMSLAFVFDAHQGGINDNVRLPRIGGQIFDADCVFGANRGWFFVASQENGQALHHCFVLDASGTIQSKSTSLRNDGSWLGASIHGRCAASNFLLAATDDGLVRVETSGQQLVVTKTFPDTEPFADSQSQLIAGDDGLYVVSQHDIQRLVIR